MYINGLERCFLRMGIPYSVYSNYLCGDSLQDILSSMCALLNEVINNVNEYNKIVDALKKWIEEEGLQIAVDKKLEEMIDDGTFDNIINEKIFADLSGDVNNHTKEIEKLNKIAQVTTNTDDIGLEVNNLIAKGYRTIKIPSGRYIIKTTIVLTDYVELFGDKNTIIECKDNSKAIITTPCVDSQLINECYIHDLTLYNTGSNSRYQLELCNATMCKVERVQFYTSSTNKFHVGGMRAYSKGDFPGASKPFSVNIDKCDFRNSSLLIEITDSYVSNTNVWAYDREYCVYLGKSSQQLNNCQFVGNDTNGAVLAKDIGGGVIELIKVNNCYFDGSYRDINSGVGFTAYNLYGSIIANNNFWKQKKEGIKIVSGSSNVINNNVFRDNGAINFNTTDVIRYDIEMQGDITNNDVSNNTFVQIEMAPRSRKQGAISCISTRKVTDNTFSNNIVKTTNAYMEDPFNFNEANFPFKNNIFNNFDGIKNIKNFIRGTTRFDSTVDYQKGHYFTMVFGADDIDNSVGGANATNGFRRNTNGIPRNCRLLSVTHNIESPITQGEIVIDVLKNGQSYNKECKVSPNQYVYTTQLTSNNSFKMNEGISIVLRPKSVNSGRSNLQFTLLFVTE